MRMPYAQIPNEPPARKSPARTSKRARRRRLARPHFSSLIVFNLRLRCERFWMGLLIGQFVHAWDSRNQRHATCDDLDDAAALTSIVRLELANLQAPID